VKALEQKLIMIGIDPSELKEENISSTVNLKSPINGYLRSVNVNIGKYVSPTDVMFEIVNNDKLFLELTLFEKDVDKAVKGQKIKFYINNGNDEYEAVITQPGKSVSDDRTFKVFATVTKASEKLLPGMYVNAVIEENSAELPALPSDAVVSFDDKDYVFIFDKNKTESGQPFTEYRMIEVTKGISASGFTQIFFPEKFNAESAKFVVKGAYNLLSAKKNAGEMAC
jgi:cobalt-zinc-cadmium efflux system membrane fusion protein